MEEVMPNILNRQVDLATALKRITRLNNCPGLLYQDDERLLAAIFDLTDEEEHDLGALAHAICALAESANKLLE
jgi:hypothetical protein